MRRIQLWRVDGDGSTDLRAVPVDELADTETERQFEDLLVASPDLLLPGLRVIGRQLPTANGPLDLVGFDSDGRLVVFELKRGTLTREAVAQILDYASDLEGMEPGGLAQLVEERAGRAGIEPIDDLLGWYRGEFPDVEGGITDHPKMVLVGLGADARATRIVDFLAQSGVEIQILTFHAFRSNGVLFLGRQVESVPTRPPADRGGTKSGNLKILLENASALGVRDFFQEIGDFIEDQLPCYRWPNKTAFSYSLQAQTPDGRPTWRNYLTLYLPRKHSASILLAMADRLAAAAPGAVKSLRDVVPDIYDSSASGVTYELPISADTWSRIRDPLGRFLAEFSRTVQEALSERKETEGDADVIA